MIVGSFAPSAGCRHVFGSVAEFAMSSSYAFHVLPAAVSWSPIVFTVFGYTQPLPSACPNAPVPVDTNGAYVVQSVWVEMFGDCPLICAM